MCIRDCLHQETEMYSCASKSESTAGLFFISTIFFLIVATRGKQGTDDSLVAECVRASEAFLSPLETPC